MEWIIGIVVAIWLPLTLVCGVGRFTEKQERLWTLACVSSIFACFLDIGIDCFARINADKT